MTGRALDDQSAAAALGPLAHAGHAEGIRRTRRGRIETQAIIPRGNAQAVCLELQVDPGPRRSGMFDDVVETLLRDAKRRIFDRRG